MLILTDLHLGKAGHFRKAGIPIPSSVHQADLQCLGNLIAQYHPQKIVMLGDLFHSEINSEWQSFRRFLYQHNEREFILVKGNHDILPSNAYCEPNLIVHEESWQLPPFIFMHHPPESSERSAGYPICGHIHPGYKVKIRADQGIKLPCFFFSKSLVILPAFGKFTGCVHIPKRLEDQVFVILAVKGRPGKVLEICY